MEARDSRQLCRRSLLSGSKVRGTPNCVMRGLFWAGVATVPRDLEPNVCFMREMIYMLDFEEIPHLEEVNPGFRIFHTIHFSDFTHCRVH